MRISKTLVKALIIFLLMILPSIPISSKMINAQTKESPLTTVGPIYVGEMQISGTGNPYTAIVNAVAEKDLKIDLPREGADVVFYARYRINCEGWNDHAYVRLWVQGADVKQTDDGVFKIGTLNTRVPHCERGDTIQWVLTATYYYLTFQPPIINSDGGGGICSLPYINREVSHPLFFSKILQILRIRQLVVRGYVIFE